MIEEKKSGSSEPAPPNDGAAPKSKRKARRKPKSRSTTEQEDIDIHLNVTTASYPSQMHSDSRTSLGTEKLSMKHPPSEKDITDGEKLEQDMDHALNDNVGTNGANIKASSGKVSPTKRAPRRKGSSTSVKDKVNDKELEEVIAYILSDDLDKAESNGKISSATVPPLKRTQRHKKKSKKELDNRDISRKGVSTGDVNGQISSGKDSPTKRTEHSSKYSMRQTQSVVDEQLGKDIDFILNENARTSESKRQIASGTVSPTDSTPRCKRYSTKDKTKANDKKLPDDDKMEMSARNPNDDFAKKQKNMDEKEPPKDMDGSLKGDVLSNDSEQESSSVAVLPMAKPQRLKNQSISVKEVMNDQKLEDDIAYILNDELTTAESNREVSSSTMPPKRKVLSPRKSSAREKKGTDDKRLAEFNSQIASGDVSPKKQVAVQETNQADDKLAKAIEYILKEDIVPTMKHCKQADELEKDIQDILKDDIFAVKSNDGEIFSSPSEVPRPKTSNSKLTLAMEINRIFDPVSVASPNPADEELAEDIAYILNDNLVDFASCSRFKEKTSKRKLTKNKIPSTNRNSTVKPKDVVIIEDVDSSAHIYFDSGYSVVPRSPENSSCEQKHAKIGEKNDDKLMDTRNKASIESIASSSNDGTPLKMKCSTRFPWKTEKVNWEEAINKILEMSEVNSNALRENISDGGTRPRNEKSTREPEQCNHTEEVNLEEAIDDILEITIDDSGKNSSDVRACLRKKKAIRQTKQSKQIEDINLDEANNEILDIPITNSGASRKGRTASGASLRQNSARQPKLSKNTEEVDLEEAISDILEIPTRGSDSRKAMKFDTTSKESKTKLRKRADTFESRGTDTKLSTAHALADTGVPDVKFPDAKNSSSSIETKNCQSGTSLGSGDNTRPMAARVSKIASVGCPASPDTVKLPSTNITRQVSKRRQTLPAILKKETTVPNPRMAARRKTAILGSVKTMATRRKPVLPVTGLNSHRTASGITYESDEVMLMEQIERESLRL